MQYKTHRDNSSISYIPWVGIGSNHLLPIFAPLIAIIKYVNLTDGLNNNSWFADGLNYWGEFFPNNVYPPA